MPSVPTFVAAGTLASGTGNINVGWPAGHQADDIGILFVETRNGSSPSTAPGTPTNWNGIGSIGVTNATTGLRTTLALFWRRATSSSESAASVTEASGADHSLGVICAFRGCITSGSPVHASTAVGNVANAATTAVSIPGSTTTLPRCLVVAACSRAEDGQAGGRFSGAANASLLNVTERFDAGAIDGDGGGIIVVTGEKGSAGLYGATTGTLAGSTTQARVSIALLPAPDSISNTNGVITAQLAGNATSTTAGTGHSFNGTLAAGSDRVCLLAVQTESDAVVSGVTMGGVAMVPVSDGVNTAAATVGSGATTQRVEWWALYEEDMPADGAVTWAVTMSTSCAISVGVYILNGAQQGQVSHVANATEAAAVQTISATVDVTAENSVVLSTVGHGNLTNPFNTNTIDGDPAQLRWDVDYGAAGANTTVHAGVDQFYTTETGSFSVVHTAASAATNRLAMSAIVVEPAGAAEVDSSGAGNLPAATGTGSSTLTRESAGAGSVPSVTGAGSSTLTHQSSGGGALGAMTGSGVSSKVVDSSGAGALASITGSGESDAEVSSSGAVSFAPVTGSGSSTLTHSSSGSVGLAAVSGSGNGTLSHLSSGSLALAPLEASGASTLAHASSGGGVLAALSGAGSGTLTHASSGEAQLAPVTAEGGSEQSVTSSGAGSLAPVTGSGSSTLTHDSSGTCTLGALEGQGESDRGPVLSSGAAVLGSLAASGSSTLGFASSGVVTLPAVTGEGTSVLGEVATPQPAPPVTGSRSVHPAVGGSYAPNARIAGNQHAVVPVTRESRPHLRTSRVRRPSEGN